MTKEKLFYSTMVLMLSALFVCSCSNDDDENVSGSFFINSKYYVTDGDGQCRNGEWGEYYNITANFSITLFEDRRNLIGYDFVIRTGVYDLNELNVGDDISDDVWIWELRSLNDVYPNDNFDDNIDGKLIVKSISNDSIVLEFIDFTFIEINGSYTHTYVMNGTLKYKRR